MKKRRGFNCVLLLTGALLLCPPAEVHATEETQNQLNEAVHERQETEGHLNDTKSDIQTMNREQDSLKGTLNNLNQQLSEVSENLSGLEQDIRDKQDEIADTAETIDQVAKQVEDAKQTVQDHYDTMKKQFKFMYEKGDSLYLELLFSSTGFGSALNKLDYVEQLSRYQKKMMEQYKEAQAELEEKQRQLEEQKAFLEGQKAELAEYQAKVQAEQSKISGMVSTTNKNIKSYSDQIDAAEEEAHAYEEKIKEQDARIAALKVQLEEERRLIELASRSAWRDLSQVAFADDDRYLLANLIYCEAGSEPYEGKVAVGAVVINRLLSSVYPDTVVGVIYQNRQFSPVASGRLALALAEGRATQACFEAADAAMNGQTPVSNCLYFRTPIPEVTPRYVIGGHIFY